jgi:hypothetical protein
VSPVALVAPLVGRPRDDVRDAGPDLLHAAGTAVRLGGRTPEDRPDHPLAVLILLDALDALAGALVTQWGGCGVATRAVAARTHDNKAYV